MTDLKLVLEETEVELVEGVMVSEVVPTSGGLTGLVVTVGGKAREEEAAANVRLRVGRGRGSGRFGFWVQFPGTGLQSLASRIAM